MKKLVLNVKRTNDEVEMEKPTESSSKTSKKGGKSEKSKSESKLPSDDYKDEVEPLRLSISDTSELVFSVKRAGDEGLPHVDIRTYVKTPTYEGFTKKGINFPLEYLLEFVMRCNDLNDECDEKGLE
jgi:hypothetical protein